MKQYFQLSRIILGHACLLLAWIIPDQVPPWSTYYHELFMMIGVLVLVPLRHLESFPLRIWILMLVWIACIIMQIPLHDLPQDDIVAGLMFALLFGIASQQGTQAALAGKRTQFLAYSIQSWYGVILVAASLSAIIGLAQWVGLDLGLLMTESAGRAYANFGQPNHFATLLVMGVAALLYFDGRRGLHRSIVVTLALLLCCALAVSESRTGALSLLLLCIVATFFGRRVGIAHALQWLLPCFLVFVVVYMLLDRIAPWVGGTAMRSGIGLNPTGRLEMWGQMLWSISQRPWAGFGWLHLGASHFAAASVFSSIQNVDHAHNVFLDLVMWFGLPLGGLFIVGILGWCGTVIVPGLFLRINKNSLCYLALLLPIALHSMLEYPYAYLYFSLTLGFFCGAVEAEVKGVEIFSKMGRKIYLITVCLTASCCVLVAIEYYTVERDYRAVRLENQFFTRDEQRHQYGAAPWILIQYGELIASQRSDGRVSEEALTPELAYSLAQRFPWLSTHLHYYLALIRKDRCREAGEQWTVYKTIFGSSGLLYAEGQIEKRGLQAACPDSRR